MGLSLIHICIGVPIAVAADRSFISSTATMTIHPIRLTGMVVGVQQSFDYLEKMQDRVVNFITEHSNICLLYTSQALYFLLTKDQHKHLLSDSAYYENISY